MSLIKFEEQTAAIKPQPIRAEIMPVPSPVMPVIATVQPRSIQPPPVAFQQDWVAKALAIAMAIAGCGGVLLWVGMLLGRPSPPQPIPSPTPTPPPVIVVPQQSGGCQLFCFGR